MKVLNAFLTISLAFALPACVYVPVVDENKEAATECRTFTKHMSLQKLEQELDNPRNRSDGIPVNIVSGCNECVAAALATIIVVSAGSVVISGSIVITNNTVHWLEYQGTCSDSYLNVTKQRFLDSINNTKPAPKT